MQTYREEADSMGTVRVPEDGYYGAQTQRAVENFPISPLRFPPGFIQALARIKKCAAQTHMALETLDPKIGRAIMEAAKALSEGQLANQFPIDIFQTGSGTSTNMNANEVIAGRANEILTGKRGGRSPVHPNDHVNKGQSSNDVIPSALHLAALTAVETRLVPALKKLKAALAQKADAFQDIPKIGRTHLQDAVPMRLGDGFSGYARQMELAIERIQATRPRLAELALGGTAVGTGLNAPKGFAAGVIQRLAIETGLPLTEARNHFEAQAAQDGAVELSGALKTVAVSLSKVANDIRWLASGPRCGIGEINLPALQPGSSIMPGKVNPVIPEAVIQVCAQVMGNDLTISLGGQGGCFELNTMLPVMAYNLLQSIDLLDAGAETFASKCVSGITANPQRCQDFIEKSLAMATALIPAIGYDPAADIAKKAYAQGKTVREVAREEAVLDEKTLNRLLAIG